MADTPQEAPKTPQPKDDFVVPVRTGSGTIELRSASGKPVRPVKARADAQKIAEKALTLVEDKAWGDTERRRFQEFAVAYVNDVRDRLETREAIAAPPPLGGLGVDRATAEWMVALIAAVRDDTGVPPRPAARVALATPTPTPAPAVAAPAVPKPAPAAAPATPPAPPARPQRREEIFSGLAKEIVDEVKPTFSDPALRARLEALLVTRFRDVRDAGEVLVHMKRAPDQGGIGLSAEDADRVSGLLEDRFAKIWKELHVQEKSKVLTDIRQTSAVQEQKRKDEADIRRYASDVWFEERFVKKPPAPAAPSAKKPSRPQAPAAPPQPKAPVIGRSQAPAPPPSAPPAKPPERPAPAPRPSVQDMAYTPKLTGPIEELQAMTLVDFRRLGRDPKEAIAKVQDKIRLLEEEDYAQRARAIAAWRGSEPSRKYLAITRSMLAEGLALEQALAAQGSGPDALTADEYNAIMVLQQSLRY